MFSPRSVCLSAGLRKNFWRNSHEIWKKETWVRKEDWEIGTFFYLTFFYRMIHGSWWKKDFGELKSKSVLMLNVLRILWRICCFISHELLGQYPEIYRGGGGWSEKIQIKSGGSHSDICVLRFSLSWECPENNRSSVCAWKQLVIDISIYSFCFKPQSVN